MNKENFKEWVENNPKAKLRFSFHPTINDVNIYFIRNIFGNLIKCIKSHEFKYAVMFRPERDNDRIVAKCNTLEEAYDYIYKIIENRV